MSNIKKIKNGVLILECLDKGDPGSEGRFLSHMFDIMKIEYQYIEVRTAYQLLALLKRPPYKYIHITTHGSVDSKKKFLGFWTPDKSIDVKLLNPLKSCLDGFTIISTACQSADKEYRNVFMKTTLCDYFIAPSGNPKFSNSVFFSHIFYHNLFILKKRVREIMKKYDKSYRNPHEFCLFSFQDFVNYLFE